MESLVLNYVIKVEWIVFIFKNNEIVLFVIVKFILDLVLVMVIVVGFFECGYC